MKQIGSIQALRAVAALMVVLAHAQDDARAEALKAGVAFARSHLLPWVTGVDLFFVISGFIMVHASQRLFATPGGAATFLARRIVRIVPLYWLVTAIAVVIALVLARHGRAGAGQTSLPSLAEIATSLGFLPFARPQDGVARPIVSLGWTLNYEMLFYVVFAAFLRLRCEAAVGAVAAVLTLLVAAGALLHPGATALAYWSDPIVIEFALGMGLALVWWHGLRLPKLVAAAGAALALAILALDLDGMAAVPTFGVDPNGFGRLLACGLPMAALLGAVVLARHDVATDILPRAAGEGDRPKDGGGGCHHLDIWAFRDDRQKATEIAETAAPSTAFGGSPPPLHGGGYARHDRTRFGAILLLGDASYALYLFHPMVIIALRKAYLAAHLASSLGLWPLVAAELVVASAAAVAIHLILEKPLTRALQRRLATRPRAVPIGEPLVSSR